MSKLNKKAQEEMVGFVLIVILVAVVAVIFLGIYLRNPSNDANLKSQEIDSFIKSLSYYTTECQISGTYKDIGQLVVECSEGRICDDSKNVCEVLRADLVNIMNSSFYVSNGSFIQNYKLEVYYNDVLTNNSQEVTQLIGPISSGGNRSCSGTRVYNDRFFLSGSGKNSVMRVEVCYSSLE